MDLTDNDVESITLLGEPAAWGGVRLHWMSDNSLLPLVDIHP